MTTNELLERGIGHNCLSDAYELGRADGYRKAENDYFANTEDARENAYNCGYEKGRADILREIEQAMYHAAFEVSHEDDGLQKWESGNWIRYKLFENVMDGLKDQKVCSNGQICKHPNCPKCGTTHSMSECNYISVK